jgi:hypothetical protein
MSNRDDGSVDIVAGGERRAGNFDAADRRVGQSPLRHIVMKASLTDTFTGS